MGLTKLVIRHCDSLDMGNVIYLTELGGAMLRTRTRYLHLLIILSVVMSSIHVSRGQTVVAGGAQGSVYDIENNQPIAAAVIVIRNLETGLTRTTLTRSDGRYYLANLPPGSYEISATAATYENIPNSPLSVVRSFAISITQVSEVKLPPIALRRIGSSPSISSSVSDGAAEALVNRMNASRGGGFDRRELLALPLPGVRTFDDLAFLLPGVAPPPQAIGTNVGPGVGPGVGTSGQFSVNGMRSRSNNFTIDGSDNNDEDIGVRRQGFTSLVPQSIESLQEFQVITLLPEPQFGRTPGAQANAVSRSGGNDYHGTLYGFFTNKGLKARDPFDLIGTSSSASPILGANGQPVLVNGRELAPADPVEGENPFQRLQYGFVLGGPVIKNKLSFFGSFERQDVNARRESNFATPTVAERGLSVIDSSGNSILTGDRGIAEGGFHGGPTSELGDAFFSLFPFPNNPRGPFGANTYTEVLPANAEGNVFSGKLDWQNIKAFGKEHNLTARYNFTDDDTILPVTGGALFSSLEPLIRTQNLSLIFDTAVTSRLTNQFRTSYGRTHLDFNEVRSDHLHPGLLKSRLAGLENTPFLLNTKILRNLTRKGFRAEFQTLDETLEEKIDGPLGQLIVSGYSPVGVDVFSFPQSRVNNIFQYADTLIYNRGRQQFTAGFDLRRVQLDSSLDRNFRPIAVFTGAANDVRTSRGITLNSELQGRDFVAVGAPTGFTQTLALNPDSKIELRSWQDYFFVNDKFHPKNNLTLTFGATYQLNTVPTDAKSRIENTFNDEQVIAIGIGEFLGEERRRSKKIYEQDKNNISPYVSVAWDPFGKSETSIRAGYGIYYDQIPGAVVSQSRSVFPSFFTFNLAGIPNLSLQNPGLDFINPSKVKKVGTLNTFDSKGRSVATVIDSINLALKDSLNLENAPNAAFPDFVLPAADLVTPYSHHWGLTIEQEFKKEFLLSAAYVGTKGVNLLRVATPNLGPNKILTVAEAPSKLGDPIFIGEASVPPNSQRNKLGSFTSIESDANSIYHALQVQLNKRLSRGIQLTTAYTWSHAIDDVSDIFDLAGAPTLPQDSKHPEAERGDANFDVRHRFVYSVIWDLPWLRKNLLLGNWQLASIGTFQTGQPYSVLYFYDVNKDGNLTDRINPDGAMAGEAGRNLFRAPGIDTVDFTLNKTFKFSERQNLEFRTEVFNAFNHSNFGVPVNQLNFGGQLKFSRLDPKPITEQVFFETRVPARTIQLALRYNF
jgi:carboxypeptidase family protein